MSEYVPFDPLTAIGLTEAARRMRGRDGRAPNVRTLRRWANLRFGCRPAGRNGPRIYLRVVRYNGYLLTMRQWVDTFEAERARLGVRPLPGEAGTPPLPRSSRERQRAHEAAERVLDQGGVGRRRQEREQDE
jgi:hypothetical protein